MMHSVLVEDAPSFDALAASVSLEQMGPDRQAAVLAACAESSGDNVAFGGTTGVEDLLVPLVRTTSRYAQPTQRFADLHRDLAERLHRLLPCTGPRGDKVTGVR